MQRFKADLGRGEVPFIGKCPPGDCCPGSHSKSAALTRIPGSGRSTPTADLTDNTTWDLVKDLEQLRTTLGIDKWMCFGGSWGSTLALIYAIEHPERVTELVLRGIFLMTQEELDFFFQQGTSMIFPDAYQAYSQHIPEAERGGL